jgi:ABC-type lipoprotein release transport system permease subunit
VVIAISTGVTMAAVAGARRSDSAYGRFLAYANSFDFVVSGCQDPSASEASEREECTDAEADEAFARVRELPFVADSAMFGFLEVSPELPDGGRPSFLAFLPTIDVDGRIGRDLPRVKVLSGRLPDPAAIDEAAIGLITAERFQVSVGDELRLHGLPTGDDPSATDTVRIVGIYVAPGELPAASGPQGNSFLLTAAFGRAHREVVHSANSGLVVRLRPGTPDGEAEAAIRAIGFDVEDQGELRSGIERTIRIETIALLLLGSVVAAVGLVVVGQMLRRQTAAEYETGSTYWALGCDRSDALRLALVRGLAVGATGASLAVVVAIVISPLFPVGIGRVADPDVGVHADAWVLAVGVLVTLSFVVVLALLAAAHRTWAARRERRTAGRATTPWPLPAGRPPVLIGLCFALPGRSRTSPARASLLSLVAVVVILAATGVTLASFDHLVGRRDLAGATWQAAFLPLSFRDGSMDIPGSIATAGAVPGVEAATSGAWATPGGGIASGLFVNGERVATQVFGDEGAIQPAIGRGRAPERAGEIALGAKTLATLGLRVGDEVQLSLDPTAPSQAGRVVGQTVLVSPYFFSFAPGTGATTVPSTFSALGLQPPWFTVILVRYADAADDLRTFNAVQTALQSVGFETADRHSVTGLGRIRLVPILLLIGLLALVAAAIAHVLLVSVEGHRRDLAVLRALGFTRPQSWTSVTVHAAVVALAACALGIPLGVMFGRAAWERIAASLYVVPRPMIPLVLLCLMSLVLVAVAVAASLVPSARAVRLEPAAVLRAD